ncbi:hypothetical protein AK812_SmicGene44777, partial [Symbiodinium microadriaticum]
ETQSQEEQSRAAATAEGKAQDVEHCALAKLDQLMKFAIMCKEKAVSFGPADDELVMETLRDLGEILREETPAEVIAAGA